jgi:hypothetical protein
MYMDTSRAAGDSELRLREQLSQILITAGQLIASFGGNTLAFWRPKEASTEAPEILCRRRLRSQAQKREQLHSIHIVGIDDLSTTSVLHAREIGNGADFLWLFIVSPAKNATDNHDFAAVSETLDPIAAHRAESDSPELTPTIISTARNAGLGVMHILETDDPTKWRVVVKPRERWPISDERDRLLQRCAALLANH